MTSVSKDSPNATKPSALPSNCSPHDIDALRDAQRAEGKEIGDKIRALAIIAEQNEGRAARMMEGIKSLEGRAGQMMDAITRLARIADIHENRISGLEI